MSNKSRKKYPERARARSAVQWAIAKGILHRPTQCERCGVICKPDASHGDYSQPLSVEWLCRPCHEKKDLPTHCVNGHEYLPETTSMNRDGSRRCLPCNRAFRREYQPRRPSRART